MEEQNIQFFGKKNLTTTDKEALIDARIGQGLFRSMVLQQWDNRCAVTGSRVLEAIRASHIKPWRDSDHDERLDPNNGIPLVASLDALFDAGLISFDSDGKMSISSALMAPERKIFDLQNRGLRANPNKSMRKYLKYQRETLFRQ